MKSSPRILVVDDDRELRSLLAQFLSAHGYLLDTASDGQRMKKLLEVYRFDLAVLDIMMPGEDGLTLCRNLRSHSNLPIIFLTALGEETERIVGLEMGADDYLIKPFNPRELLARIKAVLRRAGDGAGYSHHSGARYLLFAQWRIDRAKRALYHLNGGTVELTGGEFELLLTLAERPQRILSRDQLLSLTRGRDAAPFDRSIDVQLSRLRRKIEPDTKSPQIIKTIRSGGYLFVPEVVTE